MYILPKRIVVSETIETTKNSDRSNMKFTSPNNFELFKYLKFTPISDSWYAIIVTEYFMKIGFIQVVQ